MHLSDVFVVGFADNGQNGGKRKSFDNFVNGERHAVGGIDHVSMPDEGEIKLSDK